MNSFAQHVQMLDGPQVPGDVLESRLPISGTPSSLETELAEARRLWRAIHDPELRAACRVVAYARWRTAITRLADFAVTKHRERIDNQA